MSTLAPKPAADIALHGICGHLALTSNHLRARRFLRHCADTTTCSDSVARVRKENNSAIILTMIFVIIGVGPWLLYAAPNA